MNMKKIGIFCLGTRRPASWELHVKELAKSEYDNFHLYLLTDIIDNDYSTKLKNILNEKITIVTNFPKTQTNYLNKLAFAVHQNHEYSIKHDEDTILTASGWNRFFELIESMEEDDVFCTGAISNGIPTTELFIETHIPLAKQKIYDIFNNTRLGHHGVDYTSLNTNNSQWNADEFYEKLINFDHYYKGIHPVRVNFEAVKMINDEILRDFSVVMSSKEKKIIKDNSKYPYLCNNIFGIKTKDWLTILQDSSLYVDNFDEVPINLFRNKTKRNLLIDAGIPIIHTMYNWTPNWDYENDLIQQLKQKMENV